MKLRRPRAPSVDDRWFFKKLHGTFNGLENHQDTAWSMQWLWPCLEASNKTPT